MILDVHTIPAATPGLPTLLLLVTGGGWEFVLTAATERGRMMNLSGERPELPDPSGGQGEATSKGALGA